MANVLLYVFGRNDEMNLGLSVHDGNVLMHLPNYMQAFRQPPAGLQRDKFAYAILVDEGNVTECSEVRGQAPCLRLWAGPPNNRGYPHLKIQARVFPLNNPLSGDAGKIAEAEKVVIDAQDQIERATARWTQFQQQLNDSKAEVSELRRLIDCKDDNASRLQGELADIKVDNHSLRNQLQAALEGADKSLAEVIAESADEELEALPYIGPENKDNLRSWAKGQIDG